MNDLNIEEAKYEMSIQARDDLFLQSEFENIKSKPEDDIQDFFKERRNKLNKCNKNSKQKPDKKELQEKLKSQDTLKSIDSNKKINKLDPIERNTDPNIKK